MLARVMHFRRLDGKIVCSSELWEAALEIATRFNWQPAGAVDESYQTSRIFAATGFGSNYLVDEKDAQALSAAVSAALAAMPDEAGQPRVVRGLYRRQLERLAGMLAKGKMFLE